MREKMEIPEGYQEFCKEVGRICKKHHIQEFHGSFRPPAVHAGGHSQIEFKWEQGRHGADSDKITISSQVWVYTTIKASPASER